MECSDRMLTLHAPLASTSSKSSMYIAFNTSSSSSWASAYVSPGCAHGAWSSVSTSLGEGLPSGCWPCCDVGTFCWAFFLGIFAGAILGCVWVIYEPTQDVDVVTRSRSCCPLHCAHFSSAQVNAPVLGFSRAVVTVVMVTADRSRPHGEGLR